MPATKTRKWTAELSCGGQHFDVQTSSRDTLRDQTEAAVGLAVAYIGLEVGSDAAVTLYKTTLSGRERHSSIYVYRDYETREIRTQR